MLFYIWKQVSYVKSDTELEIANLREVSLV
jgi:hypothetical protein